jgi:hypothetical protein
MPGLILSTEPRRSASPRSTEDSFRLRQIFKSLRKLVVPLPPLAEEPDRRRLLSRYSLATVPAKREDVRLKEDHIDPLVTIGRRKMEWASFKKCSG